MKTNIDRMKGIMRERGKTFEGTAKVIGVYRDTFTRRMKSKGTQFTIAEIHAMADYIPLTVEEIQEIFFKK